MKTRWKKILTVVAILVVLPLLFILVVYVGAFGILQSEKELQNFKNAGATIVLSSEGELIGKIFTENRTNILYNQIPPYLINALIATEDARFYEHNGIDSRSLFRVFFKTILFNKQSAGGGSTITQQLAKNMFGRRSKGPFAIFINKTKEALLARRLERVFTKQDILTLYLNTVPFGENVFGIQAASLRYFGKDVEELNLEESAVLIGMLKANNLYNPRLNPQNARNRRNVVIGQMLKYDYLNKDQADSISSLPLTLGYSNIESAGPADYFLYQVKGESRQILADVESATGKKWNIEQDGLVITTTLNLSLQNLANKSFHDHLPVMQKRLNKQYDTPAGKKIIGDLAENELKRYNLSNKSGEVKPRSVFDWKGSHMESISVTDSLRNIIKLLHAGLIAVDPLTGAIKAWVGGIDFKTQPYDQVLARRQMGSTFKPILYSVALEQGIEPCYYLDNDSIVNSGEEDWSPENFDHTYGGKYTLTGALVHSMNVPTFNLYLKVGFASVDSLWQKMGFSFALNNTPSLAMGTAEANLLEVAMAYSLFSNGGFKITPRSIETIKTQAGDVIWQNDFTQPQSRILSLKTCLLIDAMLQKAVREGTGSPLGSVYGVDIPLAGKTGTTQDYADAWFAAFNPRLVMISRVGASYPSIHFTHGSNGSGSALALPLVGMTLKNLREDHDLRNQFITPFPELPTDLAAELDCPDFREKTFIDNIFNIFKKDRVPVEKASRKREPGKKSFFRRIFGKRK